MTQQNLKAPKASINTSDIFELVKTTALSCYGVFAFAIKKDIRPIEYINKKGNKEEAIFIKKYSDKTFSIDVYLVFANSIKLSESLSETQKRIKYVLDKKFPKLCKNVNVFAYSLEK